ncbi:hypothetical protein Tco_0056589, partial [Tanacetum coccineum]
AGSGLASPGLSSFFTAPRPSVGGTGIASVPMFGGYLFSASQCISKPSSSSMPTQTASIPPVSSAILPATSEPQIYFGRPYAMASFMDVVVETNAWIVVEETLVSYFIKLVGLCMGMLQNDPSALYRYIAQANNPEDPTLTTYESFLLFMSCHILASILDASVKASSPAQIKNLTSPLKPPHKSEHNPLIRPLQEPPRATTRSDDRICFSGDFLATKRSLGTTPPASGVSPPFFQD